MNTKSNGTSLARTTFPQHLEELRGLMPELLQILESGQENNWYAFVWLEEVKTNLAVCARTERTESSLDRGLVFRVRANGVNYEKSTNHLEPSHLKQMAQQFRQELDKSITQNSAGYQPLSWNDELVSPLSGEFQEQLPAAPTASDWVHFGVKCEVLPEQTDVEQLKQRATETREEVQERSQAFLDQANASEQKDDPYLPLADVQVMVRQIVKTHLFVDRQKNMSQSLPMTLLYAMAITPTGQATRPISGGLGGLEIAQFTEDQFEEAAVIAHKLSKADKIAPGRYQVITGPDVTGVIAHEAFGHTQEGDTWMKGRSIAQNLKADGVKVGNDQASIMNYGAVLSMDDLNHGTNGSFFFDHEGQLSRPQVILDQGHLSTPMTDLTASIELDVPRTANGKRESWRRPLMTRQTNTYFTPGDKTVEELIGMTQEGFLARYAHGGMEDPKGGSLTAGTSYLEEIKEGKLTGKYLLGPSGGHIELSDPVFELLDRIVAKSKTEHEDEIPENKYGGCGKYHKEVVDAGCGGPFILWENINCG